MDLALTPEQERIVADVGAGIGTTTWRELVAAGRPGLTELALVAREVGRAALDIPFHAAVVGRLASGSADDRLGVLCLTEATGRYHPGSIATVASPQGGEWVLDGVKSFVAHARAAEVLFVAAWAGAELGVFAVDPTDARVSSHDQPTLGGDGQCEVILDAVAVPADAYLGPIDLAPLVARAAIILAADSVGAAEAALALTVERVKARHQWGAPIGAFQAVQHRCADMLLDVTTAGDAVLDAAAIADRGTGDEVVLAAALAKPLAVEACRRVSASAHQLHGGVGIDAASPLHRWYRRIKAAEPAYGDARYHREIIAAAVLGPTASP